MDCAYICMQHALIKRNLKGFCHLYLFYGWYILVPNSINCPVNLKLGHMSCWYQAGILTAGVLWYCSGLRKTHHFRYVPVQLTQWLATKEWFYLFQYFLIVSNVLVKGVHVQVEKGQKNYGIDEYTEIPHLKH